MKKIYSLFIALTMIFGLTTLQAQDKENPWQISFGTNAIDVEADTNTSIAEFFNINGNWNVSKSPISMISVSKYIGGNFSFGVGASFNSISKYATGFERSDVTNDYFNVDMMLKYGYVLTKMEQITLNIWLQELYHLLINKIFLDNFLI